MKDSKLANCKKCSSSSAWLTYDEAIIKWVVMCYGGRCKQYAESDTKEQAIKDWNELNGQNSNSK